MTQLNIYSEPIKKYGLALVFTIAALLLTGLLWPILYDSPFILVMGAVALSAWRGGIGPGMLSAALAVVGTDYLLVEPRYVFSTSPIEIIRFTIFALIAFLISWLEENRHRSTLAAALAERKQREQEILQLTTLIEVQRQRLESIISNVPGIVYDSTINLETGVQKMDFVSDYARKMLGYLPDNWKTDPDFWQEVVHPDDWESLGEQVRRVYESGQPGVAQFRCIHADSREIFVEAFFTFARKEQEVKSYGVLMDITGRKRVENALAQYTRELGRSNKELEQFAYIASHDLQEPLRKVSSYLQLIEQRYTDQLDQDAKDFINFAVDGAMRMKTLINDLLSYSRVQRNTDDIEMVNCQKVLDQVLDNLQLAIEDSGAVITHDPLPQLIGNERQLIQLFQNLIGNAIKFRQEAPPQVHIGFEDRRAEWQFCVRDNGIGIAGQYLDRIFVIFQRLHSRSEYSGTGIGLAICKKVVENHGGRIWVESKVGSGTTFYFTIAKHREKGIQNYGIS